MKIGCTAEANDACITFMVNYDIGRPEITMAEAQHIEVQHSLSHAAEDLLNEWHCERAHALLLDLQQILRSTILETKVDTSLCLPQILQLAKVRMITNQLKDTNLVLDVLVHLIKIFCSGDLRFVEGYDRLKLVMASINRGPPCSICAAKSAVSKVPAQFSTCHTY
jgi:hypothetical protein